jgi:YD repeat-containing protein
VLLSRLSRQFSFRQYADSVVTPELDARAREHGAYISASWNNQPPQRHLTKYSFLTRARIVVYLLVVVLQIAWAGYRLFSHGKNSQHELWHHVGAVVRSDQLSGKGRIYLVQLGPHKAPYTVVELATWLREKYSLDTQILSATPLDDATYNRSLHLYIAERIIDQIKRDHPDLAADPNAIVIGFTDAEMYSVTERHSDTFSQRDAHRTTIISSAEMQKIQSDHPSTPSTPTSRLRDRLRRILLKDVAVLFWHLPLNNDPGSVLYYRLNPYLPATDIYQSDLDPVHSPWGLYISDPCIVFTHTPGSTFTTTTPLIQQCQAPESPLSSQSALASPDHPPDTSRERLELRLADGLLTEKHTDFFLPGPVPIRFERAISNQWQMLSAFGLSGSHNYDRFLISHDDMRHIAIVNAGSGDVGLARRPFWLSMLALNKWIDTDSSGNALTLHWLTQPAGHFDLTRFNGEIESYLPCTDAELCYLNGYQDPAGQRLTFVRDAQRNLISLSAPLNNWLRLTHDPNPQSKIRITEILDSHGRRVQYAYNSSGQLAAVTYPSSETLTYVYDNSQNLLTVAASLPGGPPVTLITNRYDRGHLISQTLADGSTYTYAFLVGQDSASCRAQITTPDGTFYDIAFGRDGAAIRTPQPRSDPPSYSNPAKVASTTFGSLASVHSITDREM